MSLGNFPRDILTCDKSDDGISTLQSNFQDGVDSIYDAVVAKGSTPASKSLSDVISGINNIATLTSPNALTFVAGFQGEVRNVSLKDGIIFTGNDTGIGTAIFIKQGTSCRKYRNGLWGSDVASVTNVTATSITIRTGGGYNMSAIYSFSWV